MNEAIFNDYLFEKKFNEAITYLELHDTISITYGGFPIDTYKSTFDKNLMQYVIDLVDVIKKYDKKPTKEKKVTRKRYKRINYKFSKQVD